jgi:hypothetical protein
MPRNKGQNFTSPKKTGTPVKQDPYDWGGFIDVRLTAEDKANFAIWSEDHAASMWTEFQEEIARGFKFSLSYDPKGDFYLACFTGAGEELIGIDLRCCLTARAPEWEQSILVLLYKHQELAHGDWGSYRPAQLGFDRLG